jgi:hypothetical protein
MDDNATETIHSSLSQMKQRKEKNSTRITDRSGEGEEKIRSDMICLGSEA